MVAHNTQNGSRPAHGAADQLRQLAERLRQLADAAAPGQPIARAATMMKSAQTSCAIAPDIVLPPAAGEALERVDTALTTWQDVWTRLGRQTEFRQAVSREAGAWAKRLSVLADTLE